MLREEGGGAESCLLPIFNISISDIWRLPLICV